MENENLLAKFKAEEQSVLRGRGGEKSVQTTVWDGSKVAFRRRRRNYYMWKKEKGGVDTVSLHSTGKILS